MNMKRGLLCFIILSFFLTGYGQGTDYRKLYREYIKSDKFTVRETYNDWCEGGEYIYLDADKIPELVLYGKYSAVGNYILSVQNGKVVEMYIGSDGSISYIPRNGLLYCDYGHMGYYGATIYLLNLQFLPLMTLSEVVDIEKVEEAWEELPEDADDEQEAAIMKKYTTYYLGNLDENPENSAVITEQAYKQLIYSTYTSKGQSLSLSAWSSVDTFMDADTLAKDLELWK
jgi:hypothetical protein